MLTTLSRSRVVAPLSWVLLLGQLTAFAPTLASAQGKPAPAAAPQSTAPQGGKITPLAETLTGEAKANYDLAITLYRVGDYDNAVTRFQQAYDAKPDPRLLWNMAACEKWRKKYATVQSLVNRYVTDGTQQALLTESDLREARELLNVIDSLVSPLKLEIKEPGATVFIDNVQTAISPLTAPIPVTVGPRHIKVTKPEFKDFEADITVDGGKEAKLKVVLIKLTHEGRVSVRTSEKNSVIAIDGKKIGSYEWTGGVPVGAHVLRVTAPAHEPYQADFALTENAVRTFEVTLKAERKPIPLWVWIGGGVLLAGGLAAASVGAAIATRGDRCGAEGGAACPTGTFTLIPGGVFEVGKK